MIKCEIKDGAIQYAREGLHIVFYVHPDKGQQYVAADVFCIGDTYEDPSSVKRIKNRGYEIREVYAVEEHDISTLRGIYASSH